MEATIQLPRNGWSDKETQRLWDEIKQAADSGAPLRGVFERMGKELGRKPNSIRNYYYMQLRTRGGESFKRAAPFKTFSREEIDALLRAVLTARGRGQSVRACVSELAGGDQSLMLRYQNKYRAILRKRPEWVAAIAEELRAQGQPCPDEQSALEETVSVERLRADIDRKARLMDDHDVYMALSSLDMLIDRVARLDTPQVADRLRVRCDLLMIRLEELREAARDTLTVCKEFIGCDDDARHRLLPDFCALLSERVAALESAMN